MVAKLQRASHASSRATESASRGALRSLHLNDARRFIDSVGLRRFRIGRGLGERRLFTPNLLCRGGLYNTHSPSSSVIIIELGIQLGIEEIYQVHSYFKMSHQSQRALKDEGCSVAGVSHGHPLIGPILTDSPSFANASPWCPYRRIAHPPRTPLQHCHHILMDVPMRANCSNTSSSMSPPTMLKRATRKHNPGDASGRARRCCQMGGSSSLCRRSVISVRGTIAQPPILVLLRQQLETLSTDS
jgi:hypothetical protein